MTTTQHSDGYAYPQNVEAGERILLDNGTTVRVIASYEFTPTAWALDVKWDTGEAMMLQVNRADRIRVLRGA
jgi:hypothetical protein